GLGAPHGILVTGGKVFVANSGSSSVDIMSASDGTGLKHFADGSGGVVAHDRLATDGTNLYWTDDVNIASGTGASIWFGALNQTTQCNTMSGSLYCYDSNELPSPYGIAV